MSRPDGPAVSRDGTIYFADLGNNSIRFVEPGGRLGTVAGGGRVGYFDAAGTNALFSFPLGVSVLRGDIVVADTENDVIRRISANAPHTVGTFAGSGARGYSNGPATSARFAFPNDLVEGPNGSIYVIEFQNHTVRRIRPDGTVVTLAGNGMAGFADGAGSNARFNQPAGLAMGPDGTLYVADWSNQRVRMITPAGTVSTVAGSGVTGYRDGPASEAQFDRPNGIATGPNGEIYVCETGNHTIRKIRANGSVTTLAGLGSAGFAEGDETEALFNSPSGIALAPDGSLVVTDRENNRIRRIVMAVPGESVELLISVLPGVSEAPAFELKIHGEAGGRVWLEPLQTCAPGLVLATDARRKRNLLFVRRDSAKRGIFPGDNGSVSSAHVSLRTR